MKGCHKIGLLALLLLILGACAGQNQAPPAEKSLYDRGLELVGQMREMAGSELYRGIYSDSEEIHAVLREASAGKDARPQAVYRLRNGETDLFQLMGISLEDLPDSLRQALMDKAASAAVTQINAMGGSVTLAAASVCTAQKLFVSTELEQNEIYLYIYDSATPAAVTFTKGEDGAVLASGMFVLYDGFSADSLEELQQTLEGYGVTVENITP